jgi:RNA-directed DNA polymerase
VQVAKPFHIPKKLVWEAYLRVKASAGGPGVDGQTIEDFELNLKDNLYRIWNRMSSGSYFPPPVKLVVIPKSDGRERRLGVPTVADRVAQNVVKSVLEPIVEPQFHPDSYGYRPGRSAHDAIARARERCWRSDWVLDLDVRAFFDTLDHQLMMRAVQRYTHCRWVLLYVERWLKSPMQLEDARLS